MGDRGRIFPQVQALCSGVLRMLHTHAVLSLLVAGVVWLLLLTHDCYLLLSVPWFYAECTWRM